MLEWFVGAALVAIGIAVNTEVERRRFYRRNTAGVEVFNSFGASLATRGVEGLALALGRLVGVGGVALLVLAAIQTFVVHR